jgi:hypothetical protein
MSLITGNKVKKTHKPRYCEKEKDKANIRILRSFSFDNNGLVKPSCGTVALYGTGLNLNYRIKAEVSKFLIIGGTS